MEDGKAYHKRGTTDLPIAFYKMPITERELSHTYWHPEIEIGMVMKGTITMLIGNKTCSFAQGEIFVLPPNQIHGLRNASKGAIQHVLIADSLAITMCQTHFFQKSFVEPLIDGRLMLPERLTLEHPAYEAVSGQMKRLAKVEIYKPGYKLQRYAALLHICAALQPYCRAREALVPVLPTNDLARQCIVYIRGNYARRLTLAEIASNCSSQPNYLCAVFKKHTGQTVMEYLNRTRVEIGSELLKERTATISSVTVAVGFSSEVTFRENFRKFKGISPREYRKNVLQRTREQEG